MVLSNEGRAELAAMVTAPYIALATFLISVPRKAGGNQFRHQCHTRTILIDYGYIDSLLHKAALTHDLIEDLPGFNQNLLREADAEGEEVLQLVLEVTKRPGESKAEFLTRILHGSRKARILKVADRLSNMYDLGFVSSPGFTERYCAETEDYVYPMADGVDKDMLTELKDLVDSRRSELAKMKNGSGSPK